MTRKSLVKAGSRKPKTERNKKNTPQSTPGKGEAKRIMAEETCGLVIERIGIKRIKAATYNPRKNLRRGDPEYARLKRSMESFGYVDPLVWNKRSGNLVGGHQRFKILRDEHRAKELDVSVVDLDPFAEKALNVALNRIGEEWDDIALAELLAELQASPIDETVTGFNAEEIDMQLARAMTEANADEDGKGDVAAEARLVDTYGVLIQCNGETEQRKIFESMKAKGYRCRVLTL